MQSEPHRGLVQSKCPIHTPHPELPCQPCILIIGLQYPNGWFRMHLFPFGTTVVANGPQLVDELCNAPDDAFSLADFAEKVSYARHHALTHSFSALKLSTHLPSYFRMLMQTDRRQILHIRYTISPTLRQSRYHIPIVRNTLTRNLGALFPALVDEMNAAFADSVFDSNSDIGANGRKGEGEWRRVVVHRNIMKLVCRVTNRVVVGAPLCKFLWFRNTPSLS